MDCRVAKLGGDDSVLAHCFCPAVCFGVYGCGVGAGKGLAWLEAVFSYRTGDGHGPHLRHGFQSNCGSETGRHESKNKTPSFSDWEGVAFDCGCVVVHKRSRIFGHLLVYQFCLFFPFARGFVSGLFLFTHQAFHRLHPCLLGSGAVLVSAGRLAGR